MRFIQSQLSLKWEQEEGGGGQDLPAWISQGKIIPDYADYLQPEDSVGKKRAVGIF